MYFMPALRAVLLMIAFSFAVWPLHPSSGGSRIPTDPSLPFESFKLSNGLTVTLHVDRKLPVVHVNQWFHVGSKNERPGRSGFAHLFEHMMFQGSKHASRNYFFLAEEAGAKALDGSVNGATNWDRTLYYITVPSGGLERVLWIESDRLANLPEALTQEKLDNEKAIVRNERRSRYESTPFGKQMSLIFAGLFPDSHPYGHEVIGSHEDVQDATLEELKTFFQTYYTPNNLSLVIAGDFDLMEVRRLVRKYFGPIPPGPQLDRPLRMKSSLSGEKLIEAKVKSPNPRICFAWNTPAHFDPDDAELDLASVILADGLRSRLQNALLKDSTLASAVRAYQSSLELSSAFVIEVTARADAPLSAIEDKVAAIIADFARGGPTAEEIARAKKKWEYRFVSAMESLKGKADLLNSYVTFLGRPDRFEWDLGRYRNASARSVRRAVSKWLAPQNRMILRLVPEDLSRFVPAELDRSVQPPIREDRPYEPPSVQTTRLPNGLSVIVAERTDLPLASFTLVTRAGAARDPDGKEGLADLTATLVKTGSRSRTAAQVEEALSSLGAALVEFSERERAGLTVETLSRNSDAAVSLLADVVRNPAFRPEDVEREKRKRLDMLAQEEQDANEVAIRLSWILGFGRDHPYGTPLRGWKSSVKDLKPGDFSRFHQENWSPGESALICVGSVTLSEAVGLAERYFGSWFAAVPAIRAIPAPRPAAPGTLYLVDYPGAVQTVITQIVTAPGVQSPDYYPAYLVDSVWGGGAGARLGRNLREEKGFTYGAFTYLASYSAAGSWQAYASVQTDKTRESIAEFGLELRRLANEKPISKDELESARSSVLRGYPHRNASLAKVAAQIAQLWGAGMPPAENQKAFNQIKSASLEAVRAAAAKYVRPRDSFLLLVGDRAKIEPAIRAMNIGQIVILDREGQPVK